MLGTLFASLGNSSFYRRCTTGPFASVRKYSPNTCSKYSCIFEIDGSSIYSVFQKNSRTLLASLTFYWSIYQKILVLNITVTVASGCFKLCFSNVQHVHSQHNLDGFIC